MLISLAPILPPSLKKLLLALPEDVQAGLEEIRIREERPLEIGFGGAGFAFVTPQGDLAADAGQAYRPGREECRALLELLTNHSVYTFEEELRRGYITIAGGHRVGLAGRTVLEHGGVKLIRDVGSFNIRLARELPGAARPVLPHLMDPAARSVHHTLIIAPPQAGKTTLLRDLVRLISRGEWPQPPAAAGFAGGLDGAWRAGGAGGVAAIASQAAGAEAAAERRSGVRLDGDAGGGGYGAVASGLSADGAVRVAVASGLSARVPAAPAAPFAGDSGVLPGWPARKVAVVDERSELAACVKGVPRFDLGPRTDVMDGCPKAEGMMMMIRSLSPDVLAVDEIGRREDAAAVQEAAHAGIRVIATAHGADAADIGRRPALRELLDEALFTRLVVLERRREGRAPLRVCDSAGRTLFAVDAAVAAGRGG
ncbi:stage III sporulation protein AA [Paenibacillus athensensis]|uniref:stage III sporulation protein AA n=1 Tax=Paenibacillus athensensis TaxID=1967502 RepID=UPI001E5C9F26|nr:stage III sporulation protein AA [Paenibacillus athensensis]